jgi:predicted amidohydrolase YtcJ
MGRGCRDDAAYVPDLRIPLLARAVLNPRSLIRSRSLAAYLVIMLALFLPRLGEGAGPVRRARPSEGAPLTALVVNAKVAGHPATVDAVGVAGKMIAAVGASADLRKQAGPACDVIDARGRFLMPGFHDGHVHLYELGKDQAALHVEGASISRIGSALRAYAQAHREQTWIQGQGWYTLGFPTLPTAKDLDRFERDRPVVLTDSTLHNVWVNSVALERARITAATPDPPGGRILRDARGNPTGILEDAAKGLVLAHAPPPTLAEMEGYILAGQAASQALGFTSMQGGPISAPVIDAYHRLDQEGKLTQRAFLWARLDGSDAEFAEAARVARSLPREGKVQIVAFKGFADGVIAAHSSALLTPYADRPQDRGEPRMTQAALDRLVLRANRAGFPVALHATGDRGVRMALHAFAHSKKTLGHALANRVEHAALVDPADLPQFGRLGVVASVQPGFLSFGQARLEALTSVLGAERMTRYLAFASLAQAGARLVFGSDAPVAPEDPVTGLFRATTRRLEDGTSFHPDQALAADAAFDAYTRSFADILGRGDDLGTIAPGYRADLILLDRDPRVTPASSEERNMRSLFMVDGTVFGSP